MDKEFKDYIENLKRDVGEKAGLMGVYRFTLEDVVTGEKTVQYYHNVITDDGLTMIANNLTDPTPDNDLLINYAALGTDATAVDETDHDLGTETYRNAVASMANGNKVAYVTAYFNQTEVSGTFYEAGIFCDGTGAADSGVLLSHVNISVVKTTSQKLTIDWTLTFASV